MRVAFFGDVTGAAGLDYLCERLRAFRDRERIDLVVVNADNSAITGPHPMGGSGTTLHHVNRLRAAGADIVTTGSHGLDGPEVDLVHALPFVARSLNVSPDRPGRGMIVVDRHGEALTFLNLCVTDIGNAPSDAWEAWQGLALDGRVVLHLVGNPHDVRVFAHAVDGTLDAVFGTLGHEASRHDYVLPGGTLLVTDVGMVGPKAGIGGFSAEWAVSSVTSERAGVAPYHLLSGELICDAVVADLGAPSGRSLERVPRDLGIPALAAAVARRETATDDRTLLRIGLIADPHVDLNPPGAQSWHNPYRLEESATMLDQAFARCRTEGVDLIVVLGDLSDRGDAPAFARVIETAAAQGCWTYLLSGNHDIADGGVRLRQMVADAGAPLVTQGPFVGQRLAGSVTLCAVDIEASSNPWVGQLRAPLAGTAQEGDLRCIFSHYPLIPLDELLQEGGFRHPGDLADFAEVHASLMRGAGPQLVFSGHLHVRGEWVLGHTLNIGCGALIEPPHDVTIVDLDRIDGRFSVARRSVSIRGYDVERVPILTSERRSWSVEGGIWRQKP